MNRLQRLFADHFPALTSRDYAIFWVGQFISVIGTWMQNTTLPYLAYKITGSSLDLGLIGFATTLPMLFLALPAGVLVERWNKRKTVIIMQSVMMIQAFLLALLTLTGMIQIWHIALLAFVLGTASAIEVTARQAMLIELAGREALPNAIAVQTTAFNLGRVIGPSLAATLLTVTNGAGLVFLSNGISYLFVIGGLFILRTRPQVQFDTNSRRNLLAEFQEGQRYIRQNTIISQIIIMMAVVGFFGFPLLQQIPALAKDVLVQVGDTEQIVANRNSALYTAQGIGALIAAFFVAYFTSYRKKGVWLLFGQFTFVISLIILSATRDPTPRISLACIDRVGHSHPISHHERFNSGSGPQWSSWKGVQYLPVGYSGSGALWQPADRLDVSNLGCASHRLDLRLDLPDRAQRHALLQSEYTFSQA